MKKLTQLKEVFNKDITESLKKYKIPLICGLVVFLLACVGIFITYAFYQVSDITPIIGGSTGSIADLDVRIMAEERDTNGNGLGSYALYPYIPEAGYYYDEAKSYCTNGSTINYNSSTYEADITAYGHDVCYLYFTSNANLDLTLHVYAENIDNNGYGTGEYTKLETTQLPSIGYVLNSSLSSCENGSQLSYSEADNMFNIEASGKDVCTAYMDAIDVDIQLKIYLQAKPGSSEYYESTTIPTNVYYELGSQSSCTGSANADALSIQNQKVIIAAASRTSCVAYLDIADGPIIQSMQTSANSITLANSSVGTTPTTYYYSADDGENYVESSDSTYTFSDASTVQSFRAYSVDAAGNESAIISTPPDNYVFNGIYDYSSSVQTVPIEVSGYYYLQVWGAEGGSYNADIAPGGAGGYSQGYVYLNAGDTLYIHTGGAGSYGTQNSTTAVSGGGVNGGGSAGYRGGAGGGGTDIRINQDDLFARVIVAGGGGGASYQSSTVYAIGGAGGGNVGATGGYYNSNYSYYSGRGGSNISGGAGGTAEEEDYYGQAGTFGYGGSTGTRYQSTTIFANGAGGGGWYGGGAAGHYNGESKDRFAGGGGGSGYVYTETTASLYPEGCLLNSNYYLQIASTHAGNTAFESPTGNTETGHEGNGYAKVTYIGNELP